MNRIGGFDLHQETRLHLLPNAWHAKEQLWRDVAQIQRDGPEAFAKVHRAPGGKAVHHGHILFSHVTERQVAEDVHIRGQTFEKIQSEAHGRIEIAMADFRSFRRSGGARGKDHQRGVVWCDCVASGLNIRHVLRQAGLPHRLHLIKGRELEIGLIPQPFGVKDHKLPQVFGAVAELYDFVELFLILDE